MTNTLPASNAPAVRSPLKLVNTTFLAAPIALVPHPNMPSSEWRRLRSDIEMFEAAWIPSQQHWALKAGALRGVLVMLLGQGYDVPGYAEGFDYRKVDEAIALIAAARQLIAAVGKDDARDRYGVTPFGGDARPYLGRVAA